MPTCWRCDAEIPAERVRVESVLRARAAAEGGPYRAFSCACGAECGALRNRAGAWLLHPLEGLADPGLLDRMAPRQGRDIQRAAVEWWDRHLGDVERFRRAAPRRAPHAAAGTPPPPSSSPPPRPTRRAGQSAPEEAPPLARPAAPAPPHELLGVEPDADPGTIRAAYRRALKLCHPDRVANLDPEIQALAHRKSKALRRAYEALLRDSGG